MPKFIYEAKRSPTDIIKGTVLADTKNSAIQKIGQRGYYLLSIEEEESLEKSAPHGVAKFFSRINLKDITDFTRRFADLLEAGLTIVKALDILQTQTENKQLRRIIADLKEVCTGGDLLSSAMARHPRVFTNLYVTMVRSGETGGALENILRRLADFSEKQLDTQTKIRTALAYPILMCVVGCATIVVLMTFVIPKMMIMFNDFGQALPIPTQILLGASTFIRYYWWVLIAGILIVVVSLKKIYNTHEGRVAIDRLKLKIPALKVFIIKAEIARFARTLSTLLNNGVPILGALSVVSETITNEIIKQEIEKAHIMVKEGSSLANALSGSSILPGAVVNMVAVGEESGRLEKSLLKIAEGYERESDEAVKILMSLMEPVLILTLGVIVGFIVISMLLPIFEMNFLAR